MCSCFFWIKKLNVKTPAVTIFSNKCIWGGNLGQILSLTINQNTLVTIQTPFLFLDNSEIKWLMKTNCLNNYEWIINETRWKRKKKCFDRHSFFTHKLQISPLQHFPPKNEDQTRNVNGWLQMIHISIHSSEIWSFCFMKMSSIYVLEKRFRICQMQ